MSLETGSIMLTETCWESKQQYRVSLSSRREMRATAAVSAMYNETNTLVARNDVCFTSPGNYSGDI